MHIEMFSIVQLERTVMEPYDEPMSIACMDLKTEIERKWRLPICEQPALDRLLNEHEYHFGDISNWPNDMREICLPEALSPETRHTYYLGSLAACVHLQQHLETTVVMSRRVSVVLSFCSEEMKNIRGRPEMGWKNWFASLQIEWFVFDLEDPRTRLDDQASVCERTGSLWFACWMDVCCSLLQSVNQGPVRDKRGILFHCFGGINRSSAALCAWLIFYYEMTTEQAVQTLLHARPTLGPWRHRPHVLWALHSWEKNQTKVIRPRIHAQVSGTAESFRSDKRLRTF